MTQRIIATFTREGCEHSWYLITAISGSVIVATDEDNNEREFDLSDIEYIEIEHPNFPRN